MLMSPCRVIASQASVPLVYVPLEAVASKWYGESERLLSEVFKAAEILPGCIIFLDEVDSLATSRYGYVSALWTALKSVILYVLNPFLSGEVDSLATSRFEQLCALWTALKSVVPYAVKTFTSSSCEIHKDHSLSVVPSFVLWKHHGSCYAFC